MTNTDRDGMRPATIEVLDLIAKEAIRWGCSPLSLWTQIASRLVAAARTSTSPQEWSSRMLRSMRVQAPGLATSAALELLAGVVGPGARERQIWLDMLEREAAFLIASVRARRDKKKAKRQAEMFEGGE